jgi:hypothetical protein
LPKELRRGSLVGGFGAREPTDVQARRMQVSNVLSGPRDLASLTEGSESEMMESCTAELWRVGMGRAPVGGTLGLPSELFIAEGARRAGWFAVGM